MARPVTDITIVGGGTAGWMAASFFCAHFNRRLRGHDFKVTLIESPNIPTVGVGEATVPAMARTLRQLEIDEREFFRRTNASFKLGVRFKGWRRNKGGGPEDFIHPFNFPNNFRGVNPAYHFLKFAKVKDLDDFVDLMVPQPMMIALKKGPRLPRHKDFEKTVNYAYHLDAGLFAKFLHDVCIERGVQHIYDDLTEVEKDERGFISAIHLKERGRHPVQLVIDCTGFRGLIIKEALGEEFLPYDRYLLNDRALAVQIPHQDPTDLEPCTRSTALGAGWSWRVPLYSRVGTGYVFSSKFRTDDEATEEFLKHLGPQAHGYTPRAIGMRIGRSRRTWVKNCVAMGLSAGFIEPLESTAIYSVEMALRWLTTYFPDQDFDPALSKRFNALSEAMFNEVRDFIVLHYAMSNRKEPYWEAARHDLEVPDSLTERLDLWRHNLPAMIDTEGHRLFGHWSYLLVLLVKGFYEGREMTTGAGVEKEEWTAYQAELEKTKAEFRQYLPSHYDLVRAIRGEEQPAGFPFRTDPVIHAKVPVPTGVTTDAPAVL